MKGKQTDNSIQRKYCPKKTNHNGGLRLVFFFKLQKKTGIKGE